MTARELTAAVTHRFMALAVSMTAAAGLLVGVTPPAATAAAPGRVTAVSIPALGRAAVLPVVNARVVGRSVRTPPGVRSVGWVTSSARPSGYQRGGNVALATHRDTGGGGTGQRSVFYRAPSLKRGQAIYVIEGGYSYRYVVTGVRVMNKGRMPAGATTRKAGGQATLTLTTCGGPLRRKPNGTPYWSKTVTVMARYVGGR